MTWLVLGQSVAGTAHRGRNTPCQDAFRFKTLGPAGEWLVVAVADGAGSASHSQTGAELACEAIVGRAGEWGPTGLGSVEKLTELVTTARAAVLEEAERLGVPPRELACTLLVAAVGPEGGVGAQIGDGAVVLGDGGDAYRVAVWPEPSEYANCTHFLTDDTFPEGLRVEALTGPVSEISAFTDGLQRLALDFAARGPYADFFRPMFATLRKAADPTELTEPLRAFLDSDRVNARTDDDKTLVLAARRT